MRPVLVVLAAFACGLPAAALGQDEAPLRNWQAPLFWTPPAVAQTDQPAASRERIRPKAATDSASSGPTPLPFVAITPCRLADTRAGSGFPSGYGPPSIAGGAQRSFTIAGQCAIPADAQAVSFNFAVWAPVTRGDLRVFPAGGGTPTVSTLNWEANILALANAAVVALGTGGAITVQVDGTGTIDLFIDVNGYYGPPNVFCIGTDCRTSWNGQDAGSVTPLPRDCPAGQIAVSTGSYQWACAPNCPLGTTSCGGTYCANLASDPDNCGACGTACPHVANGLPTCTAGICGIQCNVSYTICSGTCVNTQTDSQHCGACGNVCPSPRYCAGAFCVCPGCVSGMTCYAGTANTACGLNGAACVNCAASGKQCVAGVCL